MRFTVDNRNRLIFYGNPVGYVKADTAVVDEMFRTDELNQYLSRMNLTPRWEDGIFDRLVSGEVTGEELAQSRKGCRIWQLKKDVDVAMRFIGYEDQVRKFGEPNAENYTLVFDGDLGTSDLEQIYTICRDAPPPGYIHFTEEQKQRAAAVNLEEFLRCRGEKLLSSGREKRLASDHSVTVRGNEWYDHAEERGGHAVSFVQRFYGLSYPDAVTMLLGGELGTAYPSAGERTEEPVKPFALPPANKDMRRVFAYLIKHRSIARDVVAHFAKAGLLYEDAEYHNAVFVGTDTDGVPRHAHKRSANSYGKAFRLNVEGSDPRYSFHHVGTDRSLYVFEAPIDMLSFITLYPENWQRHSYVACCGTSIQPVLQMLEQVPQLDTILLCLDNDEAGHQASRRMREQLEMRYSVERLIPENKDWNDDLTLSGENAQGFSMNEMR